MEQRELKLFRRPLVLLPAVYSTLTSRFCRQVLPAGSSHHALIECVQLHSASALSKHASVYRLHITDGTVSFYKDITRKHRELSINSMHVDFALLIGRERNS